jgi:hypothetical protein
MQKRLLGYDEFTGLMTFHHYDELTDESHIETRQTDFQLNRELEATKELKNDEDYSKKGMKNEMLHYAHIPSGVLMEWFSQGVDIKDRKELIKMVNKPEYSYLKTTNLVHR